MFSISNRWARVVAAGAIVIAPLAALAIPAQAATPLTAQVRHSDWSQPWDHPGPWNDWNHNDRRNDWDSWNHWRHHRPGRGWSQPGSFGSN